jgi:hypothetical protein
MESLYNGLRRTGQTLETDATLRLPNRPWGNSNPNPNAFENFGSSLRVASSSQPKSKTKSQRTVSREPTRPISIKKPISGFLDSEDELDLLSSSQADPDDYKPSKKASVSQPSKYADGNGKRHDFGSKFPSSKSKSQVLAKLKFTKTKTDSATTPSSCSLKNQPDLKENSQDFGSWDNNLKKKGADKQATGECSGDDDIIEISSPRHLKSSNQRLSPPQPPKLPIPHKLPDAFLPPIPRPRPLPLPRPRKPNTDAGSKPDAIFVDGHQLFPLGRAKTTTVTKGKNPSRSPSLSFLTPKEKDGPGSQSSSLKNFPMDTVSPLGGKVQQKPLPKPRNNVNSLSFEVSTFPMPSPQSSKGVGTPQRKGKNKAKPFPLDEFDEDDADEESDRDDGKGTAKAKGRQKRPPSSPKNFPMDMISPLGGKKLLPKPRDKVGSPPFKIGPPPFKVGPPSFKVGPPSKSRKLKAFPMPSPQSSDKAGTRSTLQSKGKNKAQPFPEEGLSKQQKRMSEGLSDDERQAKKKRRSSLSYVFLCSFSMSFSWV